VIDLALHTIKVQNWDKTITVIPTHKLIEVSFKNWRGMQATGGRRIKRAIYIDQSSIKICGPDLVDRFRSFKLINEYVERKIQELAEYNKIHGYDESRLVNGRRMTNIGTFRMYVELYLKQHEKIHHGLTTMVRQLAPGPTGLPLEIYAFSNDTAWISYEHIQADIFDHILAVVHEFELKIFQNPTGKDFTELVNRS
jgi:miniconductance mechanosensitive channel